MSAGGSEAVVCAGVGMGAKSVQLYRCKVLVAEPV